MRISKTIIAISGLALGLAACSGLPKKGDKGGADLSSFDSLKAVPDQLGAKADKLTAPIDEMDAILDEMSKIPTKLKMSPVDLGKVLTDAMDGKSFAAPAGMDPNVAKELEAFTGRFQALKEGLHAIPENAAALLADVVAAMVKVPILVTKVTAESTITAANPFASKEEKKKALQESAQVKQLQPQIEAKIKEVQEKVTGLPDRAMVAIKKFAAAVQELVSGGLAVPEVVNPAAALPEVVNPAAAVQEAVSP